MSREILKMYSDYKSPYAWLAFDPVFELENRYDIKVQWRPFQLRIKGSGQRSVYSEYKVKYSYMDARRTANERGDKKIIRGPLKIYDTAPALIGGPCPLLFVQSTETDGGDAPVCTACSPLSQGT